MNDRMSGWTAKARRVYKYRKLPVGCDVLFIFWVLFFFGCGIKGPPVAPRRKPPPAVQDLSYRIDGNVLTLTWTVPEKITRNASGPSGFKVYRSKTAEAVSGCKNCPPNFIVVGDIPAGVKGEQDKKPVQISFSETLESGYRYIYMVRGYHDSGSVGADSNYIEFGYE
jgi:hypothetical protein